LVRRGYVVITIDALMFGERHTLLGDGWGQARPTSGYGVKADEFNVTTFHAIETDALRIEVTLWDGFSGGLALVLSDNAQGRKHKEKDARGPVTAIMGWIALRRQ
jgi:hypothetical protein